MTHQPSLLPDPPGRYARVAVQAPVDEPFTYRVPEALEGLALPGCRVRVRFGGRPLFGVIVATGVDPPAGLDSTAIRYVDDLLDREPAVPPVLLALCERVAREHLVGWGEALTLALPGLAGPGGERRLRLAHAPPASTPGGATGRAFAAVRRAGGERRWVRMVDVLRRVNGSCPVGTLLALEAAGWIDVRDEWTGEAPGAAHNVIRARPGDREVALEATARAPAQRRVLMRLWNSPPQRWSMESEIADETGASRSVFVALEEKGLVARSRRAVERERVWPLGSGGAGSFVLTGDQERALSAVLEAVGGEAGTPFLLHGVTGSGKTEIYLRAAAEVMAQGRCALLLVPEIGLTPQLEERAKAVLGEGVAVLHSGLSAGERQRAWWRARTGAARVVVGPRSAVFAPLRDVGLVVVDEEQDDAYKQEERPRYNGREVALWRGSLEGAVVLLGSATPAVESYRRAERGEWTLLEMPERVACRSLPEVQLVDMRAEWRATGRNLLSRILERRIEGRLARSEQVLVLLNRRGFAAALVCRACGHRPECPDCSVTLTYHRAEGALRCHYCDHRERVPQACPQCGSEALHDLGFGTERLQAAVEKTFPGARVGRFDADETRRRGAHARILGAFGSGQLDVLVGTQMLAKGHDFPSVTLVGVVGADAALGMPDFRAAERTFQLLTQMAGRAGRGEVAGEVVMQAHEPSHYAIEAAVEHDYRAFYDREVRFRSRLRYPPFAELAVCVCRGKLLPAVREEADHLAAALRAVTAGAITVLGPATPPISRLRGRYRMQLMLKAERREELTLALAEALRDLARRRRTPRDLMIDIDPRNLL